MSGAPDFDSDPPVEPRWWQRTVVVRSGIAFAVLATIVLSILALPESSREADRAVWSVLPPIDSGRSVSTEQTAPAPGGAPSPTAGATAATTADPSVPSRTATPQRPGGSVPGAGATARPGRPANPPAASRPTPPRPTPARPTPPRTRSAPRPAGLTPLSPSRERDLRSVRSDRATAIDFVNTRRQRVVVHWLDYHGRRVQYRVLGPGDSYRQPTYVTHPWVITGGDGRALVIFLPDRAPARATIT